MPIANNVYRRGAVYWWRHKSSSLPGFDRPTIALSLGTKDAGVARVRAAAMLVWVKAMQESLLDRWKRDGLSAEQCDAIRRREAIAYRNRLITDPLEITRFGEGATDAETRALCELGWTTLIDCGLGFPVTPELLSHAVHTAKNAGVVGSRVRTHALDLSFRDQLMTEAAETLRSEGLPVTDVAKIKATGSLITARAIATRAHRTGEPMPTEPLLQSGKLGLTAGGSHPLKMSFNFTRMATGSSVKWVTPSAIISSPNPTSADINPPVGENWATMIPTEVAERFIRHKYQDPELEHRKGGRREAREIDEHTLRQVRWAANLIEKSMRDAENNPRALSTMTKPDLIALDEAFERIPVSTGKSPWDRDPGTTLGMITERAALQIEAKTLMPNKIGLDRATTNKHFAKIKNVWDFLRSKLAELDNLDFSDFLIGEEGDVRDDRAAYTTEQINELFKLPPWTGCASAYERFQAGAHRFSDTLVWVLLLVWYTGLRREELCKLAVSEVRCENHVWYLVIAFSEAGRVKNARSVRYIPICDELLRLGFVQFVDAIKAAGHAALFPDLLTMSGIGKKGDVFYDLYWTKIAAFLNWLKPGQALHSGRHSAATELKRVGVPREVRKELFGQGGDNDEMDRYSKALALPEAKKVVDKIPVVTAHLAPFLPATLVPAALRMPRPSRVKRMSKSSAM